jgi:hypothetical protein
VLVALFSRHFLQVSYMPVGGYQQVTGAIRIAIHDDEVLTSPKQDIVCRVTILSGFFT